MPDALTFIFYSLQFDFLFLHTTEAQILDDDCRKILVDTAVGLEPSIIELKRAVCLISHRLSGSIGRDNLINGLFLLLASILRCSSTALSITDFSDLKEFVFVHSRAISTNFTLESLSDIVCEGIIFFFLYELLLMFLQDYTDSLRIPSIRREKPTEPWSLIHVLIGLAVLDPMRLNSLFR